MARLRGHRPLNVEEPLYVRRAELTLNGQTFHAGDVLPWKDLGVPFRKLHQLWSGRRIGHEKPGERNGAESPRELVKQPTDLVRPIATTRRARKQQSPAATG